MFSTVRRWTLTVAVLALTLGASGQAKAGIVLNSGVQNNVAYNTVVNDWGWTVAYRGSYDQVVSVADAFANATGDYVMLAAIKRGSDTFEVLAAALKTDVQTYTAWNAPHIANGAECHIATGEERQGSRATGIDRRLISDQNRVESERDDVAIRDDTVKENRP